MFTFDTRVCGIPCQIHVTSIDVYVPPSFDCPESGGDSTFHILDRKGYRAKWLENKAEEMDAYSDIKTEIEEEHENWLENEKLEYELSARDMF